MKYRNNKYDSNSNFTVFKKLTIILKRHFNVVILSKRRRCKSLFKNSRFTV